MITSSLSPAPVTINNNSYSEILSQSHDLFDQCWRLQDCFTCLHSSFACSWCAISSVCLPNPAAFPILSPIFHPDICPSRTERWELRAKGSGCAVSTFTFLAAVVTIAGTIATILMIWWIKILVQRWHKWWRRSPDRSDGAWDPRAYWGRIREREFANETSSLLE